MFTDESEFGLYGPDGNKRVWGRRGSVFEDQDIGKVIKFWGGNKMVWGAICYNGI